jgi:plasmid stabilization system protein ParE
MAAVLYLPGALEDIERLAAFLADSDPPAAAETKSLIESAIDILASHPLIGRSLEPGLRELVISRGHTGYVALYHYDEAGDRVLVLAIRHQREAGYV